MADAGTTETIPSENALSTKVVAASAVSLPPPETSAVQKIQDMFMAAAEADRAMSDTFTKLVHLVEETRNISAVTATNVLSLILRLADKGVISLSEDEYKSFGLKPKAAKIRAGK